MGDIAIQRIKREFKEVIKSDEVRIVMNLYSFYLLIKYLETFTYH